MAAIDLTKYGITGTTEIVHNPSYEMLFEEETKPELEGYEKGQETELGAVNVMTGIYTGRSPKDKYIVMDENSKDTVWWTTDEYKNDMMSYTANHIREYTQLLLEDGRYINTEKYETIDYVGLGYFVISEDTLEFTYTNNEKFKTPMLAYVHENTSYNSFGDVFLNELATYMYDRLADEFMRYNATYLHTYMATYMNTYFMQLDPPA